MAVVLRGVPSTVLTQHPITGRERSPRQPPREAGCLPGADLRSGGIAVQDLGPDVDHHPQPEILPHAREPQLQHGAQHRREDRQLQPDPDRAGRLHGRFAGLYRPVLLPGRAEGLRMKERGGERVSGRMEWRILL